MAETAGSGKTRPDAAGSHGPVVGGPTGPVAVLVLGLGNLLHRDDGLGVHALQELGKRYRFPPEVRLVEGGIGGLDLLPLLEAADLVLVLDAVQGGGVPGDHYRVPLEELVAAEGEGEAANASPSFSLHGAGLVELLRHAAAWGKVLRGLLLGLEPAEMADWSLELSPPVVRRLEVVVEGAVAQLRAWGITVQEKVPPPEGAAGG